MIAMIVRPGIGIATATDTGPVDRSIRSDEMMTGGNIGADIGVKDNTVRNDTGVWTRRRSMVPEIDRCLDTPVIRRTRTVTGTDIGRMKITRDEL